MRNWTVILVLCLYATAVLGEVIVSPPGSGWADTAWIAGEDYRWGATARNMDFANGDWELGVGNTHEMTEGGGTQANLNWGGPGTSYSFTLDYDPLRADQAIWTVGGTSVVLQDPATLFTDMYIQLKGRPDTSLAYISISNATITVEGSDTHIDDFAAGYGEADNLRYIHISNSDGQLSDMDFILAGTLNIDWSGATPSRDEMAMHIKMTQIPEPASIIMVILVSVSGLFIRRRFRL